MNQHYQLARSKRLRALLRLHEANLETTAVGSAAPAAGLPRSTFHALGIHDDVLDALAADGFVERAESDNRGGSGSGRGKRSAKPGSKQDSDLVLTPPAAALLGRWLASGMSFALPTSIRGLQPWPRTHRPAGAEEFPIGPVVNDIPVESRIPAAVATRDTHLVVPRPTWERTAGDLRWRDELVLQLTDHASVQADILDEFERLGWIWMIPSPLGPEILGDKTASKRHAVNELNERQGSTPKIHFASLHGRFVCWCPAVWLATMR